MYVLIFPKIIKFEDVGVCVLAIGCVAVLGEETF